MLSKYVMTKKSPFDIMPSVKSMDVNKYTFSHRNHLSEYYYLILFESWS